MSENKKVCGISEICSPTNNQHTRFHSANHWINMAVRSLTAIEKYLDDLDENDVCNHQLEGLLVDHKKRVWELLKIWRWMVYLSLAPSPGRPHWPGSHNRSPLPLLLMCRLASLTRSPSQGHIKVVCHLADWPNKGPRIAPILPGQGHILWLTSCEIHLPSAKVWLSELIV